MEYPPVEGVVLSLILLPHVLPHLGPGDPQAGLEWGTTPSNYGCWNVIMGIPVGRANVTGIKFGPFLAYNPVPR